MDSSTDSDTYMEDDENQFLLSGPMIPLLAVASVAEMQLEANRGVVAAVGAAAGACNFMEREHHPKQEGLADILDNMSEMDFFRHLRLTRTSFDLILDCIHEAYGLSPSGSTLYLGPRKALYVILWYLGTQSTYREISEMFGVSQRTVFDCVQRLIDVICKAGKDVFLWPTPPKLSEISHEFQEMGGIPGVVGALDGCHINIKAPSSTQADYVDRTQKHSVILIAVCLPDKSFSYIQVGFPGSAHDSRVLKSTSLYKKIQNGDPNYFPSSQYHIVGDSAFGVQKHLMVPFKNSGNLSQAQIRFNTKLSKARVTIENAFGFLKGRFRRLKHVDADIARIPKIIKACCVLHNISITQPDEINILEREGLVDDTFEHFSSSLSSALPRDQAGVLKRQAIVAMLQ